jgi:hypothetical protein
MRLCKLGAGYEFVGSEYTVETTGSLVRTGGTSVPLTIGEQRGMVSRGREIALQYQARFLGS